jgi:protease I
MAIHPGAAFLYAGCAINGGITMAEKDLDGMRVAILATDMVEKSELEEPRRAVEEAGAETTLIAPDFGEIDLAEHHDKAGTVGVDMTLEDSDPSEFDAVLLPGGALNADALRVEPKAQDFVRAMDEAGKPMAIICHAPWLLVSAGLVRGRKMTGFHAIKDDLVNAGANFEDAEVVSDDNWVSSRQPDDIPAFNAAMLQLFAKAHAHQNS